MVHLPDLCNGSAQRSLEPPLLGSPASALGSSSSLLATYSRVGAVCVHCHTQHSLALPPASSSQDLIDSSRNQWLPLLSLNL